MDENDPTLKAMLSQWRDVEPAANFEANVWRRIRLAQPGQPERAGLVEWWRRLIWQPAFSVAMAAVVAVLIGAGAGLYSVSLGSTEENGSLSFLSTETLAGGYARMTEQGGR